jgi:hypothetical protein
VQPTTREVLDGLDGRFVVVHDAVVAGTRAGIDHLVAGPPGVFAVDVKRYRWPVRAAGGELRSGDFPLSGALETIRWVAERASADLAAAGRHTPRIHPVLCLEGAALPRRTLVHHGVRVVDPPRLAALLERGPQVLDAASVDAVADVARRLFGSP